MIGQGELTYITDLQRDHVDAMQWWGKHTDPLFDGYNFPILNDKEREYWYRNKKYSFTKRCFAVCNFENQMVGYISLRNIKWVRKISELGIVFDPKHVNQGYGSDALKTFVKYYFEDMKMRELNLRVAVFNIRAEKCYEKIGFKLKETKYDIFEDQDLKIFEREDLKEYRKFFKKNQKNLFCLFNHMYITRSMYLDGK